MNTLSPLPTDEIAAFARAVRHALADLPAEELDDLLDGLEADLAEQAAEAGTSFALPEPAAYAAELRAAAGLPEPVTDAAPPAPRERIAAAWRSLQDGAAAWVAARPAASGALSFLATLRPLWWVVRAWVMCGLVLFLAGGSPLVIEWGYAPSLPKWILFLALTVVSVQWGRGLWRPKARWFGGLIVAGNVIAVLALPGVATMATYWTSGAVASAEAQVYGPPGLSVDGERVRNIFVYDAEGQLVPQAQLFDQDGHPLTTVGMEGEGSRWDDYFYGGGGQVPAAWEVPGRGPVWNVFPLRESFEAGYSGEPTSTDSAHTPTAPFPQVLALPAELRAETGADAGAVEPSPAASVAPSPAAP